MSDYPPDFIDALRAKAAMGWADEFDALLQEIDRLKRLEEVWIKVCSFEKKKYEALLKTFPDYFPSKCLDAANHFDNLCRLASKDNDVQCKENKYLKDMLYRVLFILKNDGYNPDKFMPLDVMAWWENNKK